MEPEQFTTGVIYTEVIIFVLSLLGCALFSFLETSITALRLFKLKELASIAPRYQALLNTLEKNPHQVLITILIANSLVNVTAAALITNIMENVFARLHLSGSLGFSLGIGVATTAILIFGEVIPKNLAKVHGEKLFKSTLWITNIVFYLLYPFVILLIKISSTIVSLVGVSTEPSELVTSEREIRFLIDYINEKGLMEREKTEMLQSIFKLGSKPVREIMVPAIDIIMVNERASMKEALEIFTKYQYSRLPVYQETVDNIIGMLHFKDLFAVMTHGQETSLSALVRPILFVPESMKINQLLREFRLQRKHIAIVINEHGSITGLVTLEDVLEEIVGEIRDEYEQVTEKIIALEKGGWLVDGSIDLETLSEYLDITFEVEDAITLGGFLAEQLQHVPKKGERVLYHQYQFYIQKASPKRVSEVLIIKENAEKPPLPKP